MKRFTVLFSVLLVVVWSGTVLANSAPAVSNVIANQREDDSKLVDIYYDLADADGDSCTIWVLVSADGGATWGIPAITFSGDVGQSIAPGTKKHIIWDAGADIPGKVGDFKARVYADDGKGPAPMVLVPAGGFPYQNADLGHWVYVGSFMIDKYEVTNQFYCQFLNNADPNGQHWAPGMEILRAGSLGSYSYAVVEGRENYPMHYVTAYYNDSDVKAFAAWRSTLDDVTYRLPTDQEWEKAAAWDPLEEHYYIYGFHRDTIDPNWCNYNSFYGGLTPVGYFDGTGGRNNAKSYYGCYDMCGNISELTGFGAGVRGGAWTSGESWCQNTKMYDVPLPLGARRDYGFRLVLGGE